MTTEQMLPIVDKMDKVGYYAVECWGALLRCILVLKEDPWDRLRKLRDGLKIEITDVIPWTDILGYRHMLMM